MRGSMKRNIFIILSIILLTLFSGFTFADWPPETGALVPGNGLEFPTKLEVVNESLQSMLDGGALVISSYVAQNGPIVTIKRHNPKKSSMQYLICILKGAGIGSDQNVATSKCYAYN